MKKWDTLRIIVDEWREKHRSPKNSYDAGKEKILADLVVEMNDLDKREAAEG